MPRLVKAIVTGLSAVAVAATPLLAAVTIVKYRAMLGGGFVVVHWHIWPTLGVSLLVFAAAFFWQYRRSAPPAGLQQN